MTKEPVMHGTTCYPGGRRIEVSSPFPQWTAWAVEALNKAAAAEFEDKSRRKGRIGE